MHTVMKHITNRIFSEENTLQQHQNIHLFHDTNQSFHK